LLVKEYNEINVLELEPHHFIGSGCIAITTLMNSIYTVVVKQLEKKEQDLELHCPKSMASFTE
jgi:hypothetical protein